jgi:hypothetical protein
MKRHSTRRLLGLSVALSAVVAATAFSTAGSAAQQAAPTNTTEPRILGTARIGATLTANRGIWTGDPTSYRYQWVRCAASGGRPDGSDCPAIRGATDQQYDVTAADAGRRLRVRVTATNADGSATAASNATSLIQAAPSAPSNTRPPTISGNAVVGATLTANAGQWTQQPSFRYLWHRCDQNGESCAAISGANERTYVLKPVDQGNTLRVRVTATSGGVSATATSVPTSLVRTATTPPPPVVNGCPTGSGSIQVSQLSAPARLLIAGQVLAPSVVTGGTGNLTARFRVTACGGRPVQGALLYATAVPYNQFTPREQPTGSDGWATLQMNRLRGFPANPGRQQLLVMMTRARKPGENILGGISTRRLISFPVNLST